MLKATVDDTKGKTLNEISRIVADINITLRDKKTSLAPQVGSRVYWVFLAYPFGRWNERTLGASVSLRHLTHAPLVLASPAV